MNEDFSDILRQARQQMKVNVSTSITLAKAVQGGAQTMRIRIHGESNDVVLQIPPGLVNGESIKYPKLVGGIDVIVRFMVQPNPDWRVSDLNLIKQQEISIWTLIAGGSVNVSTIDGTVLRLKVPAKTQPGTKLRVTGKGIVSRNSATVVGDMLVELNPTIPDDIPQPLFDMIQELSS